MLSAFLYKNGLKTKKYALKMSNDKKKYGPLNLIPGNIK